MCVTVRVLVCVCTRVCLRAFAHTHTDHFCSTCSLIVFEKDGHARTHVHRHAHTHRYTHTQ
jgi:hypothetical protein